MGEREEQTLVVRQQIGAWLLVSSAVPGELHSNIFVKLIPNIFKHQNILRLHAYLFLKSDVKEE